MKMKTKWVDAYMDTAFRFAKLSSARRLQVGAIAVKDDSIISIGYNGTPSGWDNNCEDEEVIEISTPDEAKALLGNGWTVYFQEAKAKRLVTKPIVLHAEMNCLMKLAKSPMSSDGAILFLTHSPCLNCAKAIYQAGIGQVYYGFDYRSRDGVDFLNQSKIKVKKVR